MVSNFIVKLSFFSLFFLSSFTSFSQNEIELSINKIELDSCSLKLNVKIINTSTRDVTYLGNTEVYGKMNLGNGWNINIKSEDTSLCSTQIVLLNKPLFKLRKGKTKEFTISINYWELIHCETSEKFSSDDLEKSFNIVLTYSYYDKTTDGYIMVSSNPIITTFDANKHF